MQQRVPGDGALCRGSAVLDAHREENLGLDDDLKVDQFQFHAQAVLGLDVGQFGLPLGLRGGSFVL